MATKRLHSMIFPGLADSYTVPQQTTELSDFDNFVKAGLAIISNGNTHLDIPADMYVYVYNHNTLDNGLYQNISGATIPVGATLTTSNVSQVTGGGLNVLKNTLNSEIATRQTYVRPNLLDNWYFVGGGSQQGGGQFPINQRGYQAYQSAIGYTIDRWTRMANSTVDVYSDCIRVTSKNTVGFTFRQLVENKPSGKFTVSILVNAKTGPWSCWLFADSSGSGSTGEYITGPGLFTFTADISRLDYLLIESKEIDATIDIVAVKLELGSTQTLAHNEGTDANPVWVLNEIPNYAEELTKCQRYCIKLNRDNGNYQWVGNGFGWSTTEIDCVIPVPVTMRANPTALDISEWRLTDGSSFITPSNLALYASSGSIKMVATVTGATQGKAYFVGCSNNGASLLVSADL